ncbi:ATP-binding cassette domain-containing protein [Klebsiella pneumoniae]
MDVMHDYSLRFANLALGYEGLPAIQNITGTIQKGSLTAIIGPNGSGKSTLLNRYRRDSGSVKWLLYRRTKGAHCLSATNIGIGSHFPCNCFRFSFPRFMA